MNDKVDIGDPNDKLESAVRLLNQGVSSMDCCLFSIAVSMKRIADFMADSDKYGCTGSAAISNAIRDGMREGR